MGFFLGFITAYLLGGIWSAYLAYRHDKGVGYDIPFGVIDWVGLAILVVGWPWFWKTTTDDHVEEVNGDY